MDPRESILIIGGYSTGRFLAPIFNGYGYSCIHVHPHTDMSSKKINFVNGEMYIRDFYYTGDINLLFKELQPYKIKFAIAGSEVGVLLTDSINNRLCLPFANPIRLSKARKDKYLMQEAIRRKGLLSIQHFKANSLQEILHWIDSNNGYPVVIKPVNGSDAEGIKFCISDEEVRENFNKIIDTKNISGESNTSVLVQEKVEGTEYVVNSVSYGGIHITTDVWLNHKRIINGQSVYDYQKLIPTEAPEIQAVIEYNKKILDALDIRYGASHSEIMYTKRGPILIETGARLSGGFNPAVTMDALGYSQLSALVDVYLNSTRFLLGNIAKNNPKKILIVSLISNQQGTIKNSELVKSLTNIKGFHSIQHDFTIGSKLKLTNDLTSSPGNIYILSDDEDGLLVCYDKIRNIEKEFYKELLSPL